MLNPMSRFETKRYGCICVCESGGVVFERCSGQRPLMEDYVLEMKNSYIADPFYEIAPIMAVWDGMKFIIYDGQHRYWACRNACGEGTHMEIHITMSHGDDIKANKLYLNGVRQRPQNINLLTIGPEQLPLAQKLIAEFKLIFGNIEEHISYTKCNRPKIDVAEFVKVYIEVFGPNERDFHHHVRNFNIFCHNDPNASKEINTGIELYKIKDIHESQIYIRGIMHKNYKKFLRLYAQVR